MALPVDLIRPHRITGMSAVLLPFSAPGIVDWGAFEAHVERTARWGLAPAVNMDTGYAHLLDAGTKTEVLRRAAAVTGGEFVAGAFDAVEALAARDLGGPPVLAPNDRLAGDIVDCYRQAATDVDRFIGFELSPLFHPAGRIWDLATYKEVLH